MPRILRASLLLLPVILVAGCSFIGGVFKAGMWTGFLLLLVFVGLLAWLFGRKR